MIHHIKVVKYTTDQNEVRVCISLKYLVYKFVSICYLNKHYQASRMTWYIIIFAACNVSQSIGAQTLEDDQSSMFKK